MKHLVITTSFCLALLLGGCATTVVRINPLLNCTVGLTVQARTQSCQAPIFIEKRNKFGAALQSSAEDKIQLQQCAKTVALLQEALANCDKAVTEHNEKLKGL